MQFGEAAHQRQPEARTASLTVVAIVDLAERRENLVDLLARDARPIVFAANLEVAASAPVRADTEIAPPSGVNFTALETRLIRICLRARSSA